MVDFFGIPIPNPAALFTGIGDINQVLLCIAVTLLLIAAWAYRNRVIFLLTGDDRLHIGSLDCFWYWCCRCGPCNCDGEWTRKCACFCEHKNLKKEFARYFGCLSVPVEVRNIVAGNLPFHGKGDFYLTIECGSNPPMSTSIAENCSPKVVHFQEALTLRIRDSILEDSVRFVVKELNIFGSQEIADLSLNPQRINDWVREGKKSGGSGIMRFQLDPMDRSFDADTAAWLALEFALAPEFRGRQDHTVHLFDTHTGVFESETSKGFKTKYKLLDRTGEAQNEPEDNSEEVEKMQRRKKAGGCCLVSLVLLIIIAAVVFRLFLYKCWKEFEHITIEQYGIAAPTHDDIIGVCDKTTIHPMVFKKFIEEHNLNIHTLPCFKGVCHVRDQFVEYRAVFFTFLIILVLIVLCLLFKPPSKRGARRFHDDDDQGPRFKQSQTSA